MLTTGNKEEVSLYFHIPFCSKKCPYCHFFVLPDKEEYKRPFLDALLQEFSLRKQELQDKRIVSIYFGGGTPTKLPIQMYEEIFRSLASLDLSHNCEITLEANPEDVTYEKMCLFKELGINRVSLGVQSLVDSELVTLARTHSANQSTSAIYDTHRAGIDNISIDLLFDLPSQTPESLQKSLDGLDSLPITHLSLYNLVLEPHTVFFKHKESITPLLPKPEESVAMLEMAISTFTRKGLLRYEISAFAHPGKESRHNSGYWTGRSFLGFGPSSFSYWDKARFCNTNRFNQYLNDTAKGVLPISFQEKLPYPDNLKELFCVELRLTRGISQTVWEEKHGPLPECIKGSLEKLSSRGLVSIQEGRIFLTERGKLFYDEVASEII